MSTPVSTFDRARIADRQARLDHARIGLKEPFVGIDRIVDELCDAVRLWYVAPELLTRPVIVNLWGMTGVGKTDLVRRLVTLLQIRDRFVEIELTNADSTTYHSSVAERLTDSGALEGRPTLLLFDEIQRFHTIDSRGEPVPRTKFSDFWELLSDGRLSRRDPPELAKMIASLEFHIDSPDEDGPDVEKRIGVWEAHRLKRVLGCDVELGMLARLTHLEALQALRDARDSQRLLEPLDLRRSLIIVSGNLDEAFTMAGAAAEADVDADLFAAFTEQVTVVDIKAALLERFKPEQVARFGNTHLIYRSLRRSDFEELIRREIDRVATATSQTFGVDVEVDASVARLIYRNGVFPVQGVRPVFSSVVDILETQVAGLVFAAYLAGIDRVGLGYDEHEGALLCRIGDRVERLPFSGRLDAIRRSSSRDKVANVAVHEAGHAVLYALHFGLAPVHITARVAASTAGGFTTPHHIYGTAASMLAQAKVGLGGGVAEEVVFGSELASVGRAGDRSRVTQLVIDYVEQHGFDPDFQAHYLLPDVYRLDGREAQSAVEKLVGRLVAETRFELEQHRAALLALSRRLVDAGRLGAEEIAETLRSHDIKVEVCQEDHVSLPAYRDLLDRA